MRNSVFYLILLSIVCSYSIYGQQQIVGIWKPQSNNYQKDTLTFTRVDTKIATWGMYYTFNKNNVLSIDFYDKCGNGSGNSHQTGNWKFDKNTKTLTANLSFVEHETSYKVIEIIDKRMILIINAK